MVWNWFRRHPVLIDRTVVVGLAGLYVVVAIHEHQKAAGVGLALLQTVAPSGTLVTRYRSESSSAVSRKSLCLKSAPYVCRPRQQGVKRSCEKVALAGASPPDRGVWVGPC
jgi:hypothetical protein